MAHNLQILKLQNITKIWEICGHPIIQANIKEGILLSYPHLFILEGTLSDDMITTGMSFEEDDP